MEAAKGAQTLTVLIPYTRGELVQLAHEHTHVVSERHEPEGTLLVVQASWRHRRPTGGVSRSHLRVTPSVSDLPEQRHYLAKDLHVTAVDRLECGVLRLQPDSVALLVEAS